MNQSQIVSAKWLTKVYAGLVAALIFFIPVNLFLKWSVQSAYVNGLLVDYLLPKLYVSDILIAAIFAVWMMELVWQKKTKLELPKISQSVWSIIGLIFLAFISRQFWATKPLAAIWFLGKLLEMSVLGIFFWTHPAILKQKIICWSWVGTLLFQALLGIYQFYTQQSFFPAYYFLGEINYSQPLFLAKGIFNGGEKILPYGTTAHPNILAGFFVLGWGIVMLTGAKICHSWWSKLLATIFSAILLLALFWTQSLEAFLCLSLLIVVWLWTKIKLPAPSAKIVISLVAAAIFLTPFVVHQLALDYPVSLSFVRRDQLNQAAVKMIVAQPWLGVGLNNFTANVEKYYPSPEVVRFVQPAHNIFLLWLAETGILGVGVLCLLGGFIFWLGRKRLSPLILSVTVILLPLWLFDHYLLTQQTGLLLGVFFIWNLVNNQWLVPRYLWRC